VRKRSGFLYIYVHVGISGARFVTVKSLRAMPKASSPSRRTSSPLEDPGKSPAQRQTTQRSAWAHRPVDGASRRDPLAVLCSWEVFFYVVVIILRTCTTRSISRFRVHGHGVRRRTLPAPARSSTGYAVAHATRVRASTPMAPSRAWLAALARCGSRGVPPAIGGRPGGAIAQLAGQQGEALDRLSRSFARRGQSLRAGNPHVRGRAPSPT